MIHSKTKATGKEGTPVFIININSVFRTTKSRTWYTVPGTWYIFVLAQHNKQTYKSTAVRIAKQRTTIAYTHEFVKR